MESPERLRRQPSWLVNQVALPANRLVADALAQAGLRRHHYALLAALDERGPTSQADLSRRTTIDRSDIVASINDLVVGGYVERSPDPADRRRNVVTLTAAGRRRLEQLDALLAEAQSALLAPLSPAERTTLAELLTRLVDHHRGLDASRSR
jgi:MarR family transcriptional regulator, lower aerobic nicotinate degradation pathway regulator